MTYEKFRAKYRIVKTQFDERPNYFTYIVQRRKFFFWGVPTSTCTTARFLSSRTCLNETVHRNFVDIKSAEEAIKNEYNWLYRAPDEVVA